MTATPLKMTAREIGCRTGWSRCFGSLSYEGNKTGNLRRSSAGCRYKSLAGTEARTIDAERSRAHASRQAGGRERRRHIAQGSAAVAALREVIFGDAEPVAAGVTLRIDALNGPARQILHHLPPPDFSREPTGEKARAKARNSGSDRKSWADNAPQLGGCQEGAPQYVVADWRQRKRRHRGKRKDDRTARRRTCAVRGERRIQ